MYWEVVHAPLRYQGLGKPLLDTFQGIAHVEALIDVPPMEGIRGSLWHYSVEDLKLEVVLLGMLLQHDYK